MTGLSHNFNLVDGKFSFTKDAEKAKDNLWFLMNFDFYRIYTPEYDTDFHTLVQKPTTYFVQFRTAILGRIKKLIEEFNPEIDIVSLDIVYSFDARKEFAVYIEHSYQKTNDSVTAIFVG